MNKGMGAAPADQIPTHGCCDCCRATALAELLGWHQDRGSTTEAWNELVWGQSCRGCALGVILHMHTVWQEESVCPSLCILDYLTLSENIS